MGEGGSSEACAPYVGFYYMLIDDAYCVFYCVASPVVFCVVVQPDIRCLPSLSTAATH